MEREYRADQLPGIVFKLDSEGIVESISPEIEQEFGLSSDSVAGKPFMELLSESSREQAREDYFLGGLLGCELSEEQREDFQDSLALGRREYRSQLRLSPDPTEEEVVELDGIVLQDESITGDEATECDVYFKIMTGTSGDDSGTFQGATGIIYPWEEQDNILQMEEKLTEHVMDEIPVGLFICRPDLPTNAIIYVNPHFLEITGFERHQVIGSSLQALFGEETDAEALMPGLEGEESINEETILYTKDETPFWSRVSLTQPSDSDESMRFTVGILEDITQRKEIEEQLRHSQEQLEHAFGKYMTRTVMEKVIENPDSLKLGGERKQFTVLYADVADFTGLSREREAEQVADSINNILTEATKCVFEQEGILDKYIGDAMVAEFGIFPDVEPENHALRASKTALAIQNRLTELELPGGSSRELKLRVGIHTGEGIVGNMGSEMLFDFTAIGDTMNLGSYLEELNKQYGTQNLISKSTYRDIEGKVVARRIDQIDVAGRRAPLDIYELIATREQATEEDFQLKHLFEEALMHYEEIEFGKAKKILRKLRDEFPEDQPTRKFLKRLETTESDPSKPAAIPS